ncbi:MAG: methyltransferase domain-containing protein [Streptosporangiaceae bacterium]
MPSLVVRMYQHARVYDGADALDVGVGSGYGCALLAKRLGDTHVSSIDVDAYLAEVAARRLERVGLHPRIATCDATGPLPGTYDRIVSMVSVRPIPPGWLQALRPGGRLVTTVANTLMVVTADKVDGRNIGMICGEQLLAVGRVERDCAGFMETRSGQDYPPGLVGMFAAVRDQRGEQVTRGPYPVIDVDGCGELDSVLEVLAPGIEHRYEEADDGTRTAWMLHADGSWARASARGDEPPLVHQSGPRHLWDLFDEIRHYWLTHGYLQLYGARAFITASGTIHLARGDWQATIS